MQTFNPTTRGYAVGAWNAADELLTRIKERHAPSQS